MYFHVQYVSNEGLPVNCSHSLSEPLLALQMEMEEEIVLEETQMTAQPVTGGEGQGRTATHLQDPETTRMAPPPMVIAMSGEGGKSVSDLFYIVW